jgi:adenine deaminase
MYTAVKAVEIMRGGIAVVRGGRIEASLSLPVAGLMSGQSLAETAKGWQLVNEATRVLGSRQREPLMELSFLALPVIPKLKITDQGLVDVEKFEHVSLFAS